MFIHTFLETKNTEFLERVSPRNLRFFLEKENISFSKYSTKKILIQKLLTYKKQNLIDNVENYDLFGNEILYPVKGSDGLIYDKVSMEYLLKKIKKVNIQIYLISIMNLIYPFQIFQL